MTEFVDKSEVIYKTVVKRPSHSEVLIRNLNSYDVIGMRKRDTKQKYMVITSAHGYLQIMWAHKGGETAPNRYDDTTFDNMVDLGKAYIDEFDVYKFKTISDLFNWLLI